ncbi:MAG: hypothetical protein ACYTG1_11490 [Planctomycetota bacterium]
MTAGRGRRRLGLAAAVLVLAAPAAAENVEGIRPATTKPVVPRGGVILLPLDARRHGSGWPATLDLELGDGRVVTGTVAWIAPRPRPAHRHWTAPAADLGVRVIAPTDDSIIAGAGSVVLVARLPSDAAGELRLGRHRIRPTWHDVPASIAPPARPAAPGTLTRARIRPDRPAPASPFESWRWTLLADRLGVETPPPPRDDELTALVAEHYADTWRIGLGRLADAAPAVATRCRDLLTATARDRGVPFACWETGPGRLSALLELLLDFRRSDRALANAAAAWADAAVPLLVWVVGDDGDRVKLALVNPGHDPLEVRVAWAGQPPLVVDLPGAVLSRIELERPLRRADDPEAPGLLVQAADRAWPVAAGPGIVKARPPGVVLGPLAAPLTLAAVRQGQVRAVPEDRATWAQIRRHRGRWEVFFECRRPGRDADATPVPEDAATPAGDLVEAVRGREAVALVIGDPSARSVSLVVPETGPPVTFGGADDGTLEVHRRSEAGRWLCRVVLPSAWLAPDGRPTRFGVLRGHGGDETVELGPGATVPWRPDPGRLAVDLSDWEALRP